MSVAPSLKFFKLTGRLTQDGSESRPRRARAEGTKLEPLDRVSTLVALERYASVVYGDMSDISAGPRGPRALYSFIASRGAIGLGPGQFSIYTL